MKKSWEKSIREILIWLGIKDREVLKNTPKRWLKMLSEFKLDKKRNWRVKLFENGVYDELVICKEIEFWSLCEHHLVPFFGKVAVAYLPGKRIVGLSKIARAVEFITRKVTSQERITSELADFIMEEMEAQAAFVLVEGEHLCMSMRGVRKSGHKTITSAIRGRAVKEASLKQEILKLIK